MKFTAASRSEHLFSYGEKKESVFNFKAKVCIVEKKKNLHSRFI